MQQSALARKDGHTDIRNARERVGAGGKRGRRSVSARQEARGKEEEKKERTDEDETKDDEDEAKMMTIKEVVRDACEEGGYALRRRNSSLGVNECTTTETTKGGEGGRGEGSSYGVSLEEQILILSTSSS